MIKHLIVDVDGTMTDGKLHIGKYGEVYKSFDVKDGYGIAEILSKCGVTPVVITRRYSGFSISDSLKSVRKSVFIYETIIVHLSGTAA